MKILYLHGWQSVVGGVKPTFLSENGHDVIQPSLPGDDFTAAVSIAQHELERQRPDIIVGSSRGGAVAMNLAAPDTPLLLLCPAWKRWGNATTVKAGSLILHAKDDEIIPYGDSLELLHNSGLPESALITTGYEHRLSDSDSLQTLLLALTQLPR